MRLRPLDLKLLRDLGSMKGQTAAISLVMACGLAVLIMARGLIVSLETTRNDYYVANHFADVFCELKRAPNSLRAQLAEISGVAAIDTRVKGALTLDIPGMKESASGVITSLPDGRPQTLNLLHLKKGRLPKTGSHAEVVVDEPFAKAHGFEPGDSLEATIYGFRERLRIVGIGLCPEYLFESRPGDPIPDYLRFGVFWMSELELARAFNLAGAFNSVAVRLAPEADLRHVKAELDRILGPYGGLTAYDRTEHLSAKMISDEIRMLRSFSLVFPIVFLSIAAFMTSAALTRLVRLQREQIAQLKAFGYTSAAIGWHYFKFALVAVAIATVVGGVAGMELGNQMVLIYERFYHFPRLLFHPDWVAIAMAILASAAAAFLGVLNAVRQAIRLAPAEAMRPEPPAEFRPSLLERLGLQALAPPAFRMSLRNVERRPWQAILTTLGLAFATAIPILPGAMRDGINFLMDFQWQLAQKQDVTVILTEPRSMASIDEMRSLPGVFDAEPFRAVASRLRFGHRERRVAVTGLNPNARLNRLLDARGDPVTLPPSGLLLSTKLAEVLGVKPGDSVRLEIQEGRRPILETVFVGPVTDFAGIGAFMSIEALRRLLREDDTVSGAYLKVDSARLSDLLAKVKEMPLIASSSTTAAARASFKATMGDMMGIIQTVYSTFAIIVAFGVVYNSARIALSERTRDLATLRVLGFTQREVAAVLIGELAVLTLAALAPGFVIGSEFARILIDQASTESVRLPLVLTGRSYAIATLIVLVASSLSFGVVSRRIHNLDLLGVLKAHE